MLLELAPGLRVVRRGVHHLQVGLYDGPRTVLPRSPTTERVIGQILDRQPVAPDEPGVGPVVTRLVESGCARTRDDVLARAERRRTARVAILGDLADDPVTTLGPFLSGAGLAEVRSDPLEAEVVLVLSRGELEREALDGLLRRRVPHLVVRTVDGGVVLGPFVVPGRTACVRCIDAHLSLSDPDHLAVLSRYVVASQAPRGDGGDDLAEPVLVALALAWAVRDLLAHLDGGQPTTWSRTVRLGPEPAREVQTAWPPHPDCGCCWPGIVPI